MTRPSTVLMRLSRSLARLEIIIAGFLSAQIPVTWTNDFHEELNTLNREIDFALSQPDSMRRNADAIEIYKRINRLAARFGTRKPFRHLIYRIYTEALGIPAANSQAAVDVWVKDTTEIKEYAQRYARTSRV